MDCPANGAGTGVLTNALGLLDCYSRTFVQGAYTNVFGPGSALSTALTGALCLYVAIFGVRVVLGIVSLRLDDVGPRMFKIGFILALVSAWPVFEALVMRISFDAPLGLGSEMLRIAGDGTAATSPDVISALDRFYDRMMDAASAYMQRASLTNLDYYLGAGFVWATTALAMVFAFGFLLVAKLATTLLVAVGPLFIALFLFGGTRGLFEGWVRALVGFALVPLFLLCALALLIAITDLTVEAVHADAAAGKMTWDNLVLLFVVTAGFALLFVQIPHLTASIAGGFALGGVAAAMTTLGVGASAAALGAPKLAARGVRLAVGGAHLAYSLRSPAARALTGAEFSAAGRRAWAGLGERARWWNRVATTPVMRQAERRKAIERADPDWNKRR